MKKRTNETKINPLEIRKQLGLNQSEFWGPLGVTQSGGSRYESGRNMPKQVEVLLRLRYEHGIENIDALPALIKAVSKEHGPKSGHVDCAICAALAKVQGKK